MQSNTGLTADELNQYLDRIGLSEDEKCKLSPQDLLHRIQELHAVSIPFENLQVILPNTNPLSVSFPSIFKKLVIDKRGGYCFEHSTLLYYILRSLSFRVEIQAARVILSTDPPKDLNESLTHVFLIVSHNSFQKDQNYLVDVGFGGFGPSQPLLLGWDKITKIGASGYIFKPKLLTTDVIKESKVIWQLIWFDLLRDEKPPLILYEFDICREFTFCDIKLSNYWVSTHPNSIFVTNLFISALRSCDNQDPNNKERISFWNLRKSKTLISTNEKTYEYIKSPEELNNALEYIGLPLDLEQCITLFNKITVRNETEFPPPVNA